MRPPPTNSLSAAKLSQKKLAQRIIFWSLLVGFLVMTVSYWLLDQAYEGLQADYEAVLSNKNFQYQENE